MLAPFSLKKVFSSPSGLVTWHLAIGLNTVFLAIELPAGVAHLDPSLADMDGVAFTPGCCFAADEQMAERKKKGGCFLQCDS